MCSPYCSIWFKMKFVWGCGIFTWTGVSRFRSSLLAFNRKGARLKIGTGQAKYAGKAKGLESGHESWRSGTLSPRLVFGNHPHKLSSRRFCEMCSGSPLVSGSFQFDPKFLRILVLLRGWFWGQEIKRGGGTWTLRTKFPSNRSRWSNCVGEGWAHRLSWDHCIQMGNTRNILEKRQTCLRMNCFCKPLCVCVCVFIDEGALGVSTVLTILFFFFRFFY
jgi:hypothetical protein